MGLAEKSRANVPAIFKEMAETFERKNADYGNSVFEPSDLALGITVEDAIAVRMSDKVKRIRNLRAVGAENRKVDDESLADTIQDLAVYGVLWLAHIRALKEARAFEEGRP